MVKLYRLSNLDCAVCANKMEKAVKKIKGVKSASVSYINQTMIIDAENINEIYDEIVSACRKVEPDLVIR